MAQSKAQFKTWVKFILLWVFCCFAFCVNAQEKQEKELKIVSPHWDGYRREIERGFVKWYEQKFSEPVSIRWIDLGGGSDIVRSLVARQKIGDPLPVDIVFGGGVDIFDILKKEKLLSTTNLPPELQGALQSSLGGNRLIDPDNMWFAVSLTTFGIVANRILLDRLSIAPPALYGDLTSESFKALVGSADPRKSGTNRFMFELILQRYGWEEGWRLLYKIASNVKSFSVHSSQSPKDVASGELAVALLVDSYAQEIVRKFGPERISYTVPKDTYSFFGDPIAKLVTVEDSELADRFIEFCLSAPGQSIISLKVGVPDGPTEHELTRLPVFKEIYARDDIARSEKPFLYKSDFVYQQAEASRRWDVTTKLLGVFTVDFQPLLAFARYQKNVSLDELPPPVSASELDELIELGKKHGVDSLTVDAKLREYRRRFATYLPQRKVPLWVWGILGIGGFWLIKLIYEVIYRYR